MEANETLSRRAYIDLRSDIMYGRLRPNSKLKLDELGKRYQVGTTPIREALHLLSSEGMVQHAEQKGFRVSSLSLSEYADILEIRCWFEERALRTSIEHGCEKWEDALVLSQYHLAKTPRWLNCEQGQEANIKWEISHQNFHAALISACPSSILLKYCAELYNQNSRYCFISHIESDPKRNKRNIRDEHAEIAEAALARNADLACELLLAHYRNSGEILLKKLDIENDDLA